MKTESIPLKNLLLVLAGVLAFTALPLAHAVPTLKISYGGSAPVDVTGFDINPAANAITYSGGVGGFLVNITTGISSAGGLTLTSASVSGAAAGELTISFSDDFSSPTYSEVTANLSLLGPTPGSVSYKVYAGGTSLFGDNPLSLGTTVGAFTLPANLSLTQEVKIQHGGAGVTNFVAGVNVPDGGSTAALLGLALVGVAGLRRKLLLNTA